MSTSSFTSSVTPATICPDVQTPHVVATSTALDPRRLGRAKAAYTTRFVADYLESRGGSGFRLESGSDVSPRPGDVVLARVVELGKHQRLESPVSRRQLLFVGDEVLVAYGHRYAPDQFEAEVPDDLREAHLVAAGGLAGLVTAQHSSIDVATRIQPLGLLADDEGRMTLERLAPRHADTVPSPVPARFPAGRPPVIAVVGTSMNSGKSTTLAHVVRGLTAAGLTVSAGKATGTGAGGDPRLFADAGADRVLDFTDFGHGSTFRLSYDRVRALLPALVAELTTPETDMVVVEIADGVYQEETARLLVDPVLHAVVDRVVFAAADALGAVAGVAVLDRAGLNLAAVSGVVTGSPLAAREAATVLDVPVVDTFALADAEVARTLLP